MKLGLAILFLATSSRGTCKKIKLSRAQNIVAWSAPSHAPGFYFRHQGNWWALVTDNGKPSGRPVVQGKSDPAPGYYVSTTALYDPGNPNPRDPHRYVDAAKVPYVVLPSKALNYARLSDFATVVNLQNGRISGALVADESAPDLPVGEGSIALAKALGIDSSPRYGGKDGAVVYLVYHGSGNGRPRPLQEIAASSKELLKAWGGFDRLNACLAEEQPRIAFTPLVDLAFRESNTR